MPSVETGERIYAIGDVHGRLDLLEKLLQKIEQDNNGRLLAQTKIIFLGDLIDRGPDSRRVIERAMALANSKYKIIFLKGNHEELFIKAYRGDRRAASVLNRVGGRETLLSYGVTPEEYDHADLGDLLILLAKYIPENHINFIEAFEDWHVSNEYVFVHAGLRPHVPLTSQRQSDLRWIRREFLEHRESHGLMVVHGHSVCQYVDEQSNRIGIDTGAWASGRLTAVALEEERRWYLNT